jgi:hypothetical protein
LIKRFGIAWFSWRIAAVLGLAVVFACAPAWVFAVREQCKGGAYTNPHGSGVWAVEGVESQMDNPVAVIAMLFVRVPQARHDYQKFGTSLTEYNSGVLDPTETRGWSFGWPLRTLRFSEEGSASYLRRGFVAARTSNWINGWQIEPAAGTKIILPVRPAWPGMAWNLGFWGAAFASVLIGLPLVRKVLWKRRGQCAACGYDLRSLAAGTGCPECGHRAGAKGGNERDSTVVRSDAL